MALTYPENRENYKYKGTISFTAFDEKLTDVSLGDLEKAFENYTNALTAGWTRRALEERQGTTPEDIDSLDNGYVTNEQVESFKGQNWVSTVRSDNTSGKVKSKSETTTLYLPPNLQFSDGVAYDNAFELGAIGTGALEGVRQGRSIASSVLKGIDDAVTSFMESLSGPLAGDVAKVGAVRAASKNTLLGGVTQLATGVQVNPNRRTIMGKGPNIRRFTFTFSLIPSSVSEAETIKKIILFFRSELYPREIIAGNIGVGYEIPRKFDIRIKYDNTEIATKILPCYLESASFNYNPTTMSFHKGGEFAEIQMSLSFVEERALNKQDIIGVGYDVDLAQNPELKGFNLQKKYEGGY